MKRVALALLCAFPCPTLADDWCQGVRDLSGFAYSMRLSGKSLSDQLNGRPQQWAKQVMIRVYQADMPAFKPLQDNARLRLMDSVELDCITGALARE